VLEALWLCTGREVFVNLFNFWLKIFAVAFGISAASGRGKKGISFRCTPMLAGHRIFGAI